jgi:2-oxoglutarate dehydrogenase E2 component (dihydrolipoamide succinyltransferase)
MLIELKAPELSESVQSGTILEWRKKEGEGVERDETLVDLETDKVILEVSAPASGVLTSIRTPGGTEVKAGEVLALIETAETMASASAPEAPEKPLPRALAETEVTKPAPASPVLQAVQQAARLGVSEQETEPGIQIPGSGSPETSPGPGPATTVAAEPIPRPELCPPCPPCPTAPERTDRRVQMTRLRQRIAERMVEAQHNAAILTTFNEVDMQPVMELRARYQERFQNEHGVKLGLMSFFAKAACQALRTYPVVNASVDGRDIVYHEYYDIGVAVSSERGLVVPVLRNADRLSFADIEQQIVDFARRANELKLSLEELEGGTFTISNGGVFGSLLSTPILNPPQSGVLGLHRIQDRPMAENGQVVIRPMMYLALSYDHRIIDGRDAVGCLRAVKEALEDPARLLLEL